MTGEISEIESRTSHRSASREAEGAQRERLRAPKRALVKTTSGRVVR